MSESTRGLVRGGPIAAAALMLLAACGQTGKLYLPESGQGEVVTRPSQTPPPAPGTPAPEVTRPEVTEPDKKGEKDGDEDKKDAEQSPLKK